MPVENAVYRGSKPVMSYCLAGLTSLNDEGAVLRRKQEAVS